MALALGQLDADAALGHVVLRGQRLDLLVEPELRVLQVDRVDRVRRHRDHQALADDFLFLAEADDRRLALARLALVHAVEVDEVDRLARAVPVGDAVAQAGADEGQVRIGVLRLVALLLVGQLVAQLQLVVLVAGAFREDRLEDLHERLDARLAFLLEPRRQALIEVAGGRVEGAVERPREGLERRRRVDPGRPGPRR